MNLIDIDVKKKFNSLYKQYSSQIADFKALSKQSSTILNLMNEAKLFSDIMEALFYVFRVSIEESNADKRYFLQQLSDMNRVADAVGDYLKELANITNEVKGTNKNGINYDEKILVASSIRKIDNMSLIISQCNTVIVRSKIRKKRKIIGLNKKLRSILLNIRKKLKFKITR